ncbi:unnamed protein product [Leptidea sinapis]|uniref:DMAP1-binding domain-containing protein n=1 Tax=Leptidea sinapis TaxID=189913 RepID=A0A5E4QN66_9NEOP|nr:unnamed protein product [Leptidea sinapis]
MADMLYQSFDVSTLPDDIRDKLAELDLELSEGDITQKGYEKKRTRLLAPFIAQQQSQGMQYQRGPRGDGGSSRQHTRNRRTHRRVTHNEKRYHSEVRQEAVQQALAEMQNRPKPSLPMPSKRTSMMAKSPDRERHDLSSSSDEDSCAGDSELPPPPELGSPPSRRPAAPHPRAIAHPLPLAHHHNIREKKHALREKTEIDLSEITQFPAYIQPDVTHTSAGARRSGALVADRVQCYAQAEDTGTGTGRWKVSAKIQQLLNTLKRPKRRPLPEFYEDDDIELELAANPKDPNAPKPEGGTMTPAVGEQLVVPTGLPRNLEAALQRYGTASFKANVATVLDPNGKLSNSLTYGKLLSRSLKIAHALLNKTFTSKATSGGPLTGDNTLKPGDRAALVYPNNDPINFMCAFYGCLQAGVVPVPIEVPLTRRDAGLQQVGFLLGSCGIQYALTSDACLKETTSSSSRLDTSAQACGGYPSAHRTHICRRWLRNG